MDQIRGLENELEFNYNETDIIITDKILLNNKRSNFDEFEYEGKVEKLTRFEKEQNFIERCTKATCVCK